MKLHITLLIGPWGFTNFPIGVYFSDKPKDLCNYTRGEGQALSFVLKDTDLDGRFAEFLERGLFLEMSRRGTWKLKFTYFDQQDVKETEKEWIRSLEALDRDLDNALESGDLIVEKKGIAHRLSHRQLTNDEWTHIEEVIKGHKMPSEIYGHQADKNRS